MTMLTYDYTKSSFLKDVLIAIQQFFLNTDVYSIIINKHLYRLKGPATYCVTATGIKVHATTLITIKCTKSSLMLNPLQYGERKYVSDPCVLPTLFS